MRRSYNCWVAARRVASGLMVTGSMVIAAATFKSRRASGGFLLGSETAGRRGHQLKIASGHNANQASLLDHWQFVNLMLFEKVEGMLQRVFRANRDRVVVMTSRTRRVLKLRFIGGPPCGSSVETSPSVEVFASQGKHLPGSP